MMAILQMYLEIINAHARARCVQLAGAIFTSDPRVVAEFGIRWRRCVWTETYRSISDGRNGGIAHISFESIRRISFLQSSKSCR